MDLKPATKIPLLRVTHSVRASQAVLQYGVGAMVDFPDQTLMTAAPEYWQENVVQIHDERLEKALHVEFFGVPGNKDGISYSRFPEWYFCPMCRKFQPLNLWIKDYMKKVNQRITDNDPNMIKHMRCPTCNQELVVTRIVTVCKHGHIDDFPWVKWVHCQSIGGSRKICDHPSLTFKTGASSTEGLEGLVITCENCGAKANLKGAFDVEKSGGKEVGKLEEIDKKNGYAYNFYCTGRHPWKNKKEACDLYPRVMQRGSSSVYFPVTVSSLVIPPYSSNLTSEIEKSTAFSECKLAIAALLRTPGLTQDIKDTIIDTQINQYSEKIGLEIGAPREKVTPVLERKWRHSAEEYSTIGVKYRAEEYDALSGESSFNKDDYGDFQRESTDITLYDVPYIKSISLIHKIREVQALIGFSRVVPADKSEPIDKQSNVVSIKEPDTDWYPAYEVRGEGIFIEFDENAIDNWRNENNQLQLRIDRINDNYKKSFVGSNNPRTVTSKFVLLHTISHLLIKQLSFECGYNIASLKERIYCSEKYEGKSMAGILIYTASGDSEGTLGGLVRQGYPDAFPSIYKKAIESAVTCSNDPVCSLSLGQGRDSLNLASCYSCSLIPETSCEEFNVFLDRGTVVGTYDNYHLGLFYDQVYGSKQWKRQISKSGANNKQVIIPKTGTDLSDVGYSQIWEMVKEWTTNPTELSLLSNLQSVTESFVLKEKPVYDCTFMVAGLQYELKATLLWKKSKVMFFSSDDRDVYEKALADDWTCFCGDDANLSVETILNAIKGE